ncbi:MAG: 8-oxo-dGTP diphosphatase [Clostridia bacterium]|nr:8-oxo-dGTP diphosphatase [Clostridia bacterium]
MSRTEEVELTNMCMVCDGKGNVLVQNKINHPTWHGWNFPGGHVEAGEYVTPSVIREIREETGLIIQSPKLCGIKEFHKAKDGKRYIVFLYIADKFSGELKPSGEGEIFWYPLADLAASDQLIGGFAEMLPVFMDASITEIYYQRTDEDFKTIYC